MIYNKYFCFKEALSSEHCQKIINLGLSKIEQNKKAGISVFGTTHGGLHKQSNNSFVPQVDKTLEQLKSEGITNSYARDSEIAWLNDKWLYELIVPFVNRANVASGWNFNLDQGEVFQFTVYNPGGFYSWHNDSGMCHFSKYKRIIPGITPKDKNGNYPPTYVDKSATNLIGKIRKLSTTINLNLPGEYEGGNLKFDFGPHSEGERYHECIEIRPQGSIIVFPSFIEHQVTPVKSGTRYSLVLWSLGNPFR
jgi:PKHD-type hydroxylase